MRILIVIILILLIELISANKILRTNNFCMLISKRQYQLQSSSYNECSDKVLNISCGKNMCTNNITECDAFLITEQYHSLFEMNRDLLMLPLRAINKLQNQSELFKNFKNKIKNCALKQYVWQSNDVCLKRKKCYISVDNSRRKKFMKSNCPCNGFHFHECKTDYCARSEEACNAFSNRNRTLASTKTCPFLYRPFE